MHLWGYITASLLPPQSALWSPKSHIHPTFKMHLPHPNISKVSTYTAATQSVKSTVNLISSKAPTASSKAHKSDMHETLAMFHLKQNSSPLWNCATRKQVISFENNIWDNHRTPQTFPQKGRKQKIKRSQPS